MSGKLYKSEIKEATVMGSLYYYVKTSSGAEIYYISVQDV